MTEDVTIIGAGMGGLIAAKTLAEDGFSPLVLEKSKEFGQKPCGELIIENFYGFSIYDFLDDPNIIEKRFDKVILNFCGREYVVYEDSLKKIKNFPSSYCMVSRKRFEEYLAEKSQKAGARIYMGVEAKKIERKENLISINDNIKTKLLIGADGVNSKVLTFTNQKLERLVFGIRAFAKTDFEYPHIFFGPDIISRGYAWIFPKKEESNVGIGSFDFKKANQVKPAWDKFCHNFKLKPEDVGGSYLPNSLPIRTYFDNILLVGDAASFIDSFTGGGIHNAIVSGYLAAKTAKKAIEENKFDAAFLKQYERQWKKLMYKKLFKSYIFGNLFYSHFINHKKITSAILKLLF